MAVPILYTLRAANPSPPSTQTQDLVVVEAGTKPSVRNILKLPGITSHMFAALALLAILDILVAFMPLVGEAYGVSPMVIGALLAIRGATSVLSRVFIRSLSARYARNNLLLVALLVSAAAIAVVPGVRPPRYGWGLHFHGGGWVHVGRGTAHYDDTDIARRAAVVA